MTKTDETYSEWLGVTQEHDARQTVELIAGIPVEAVVVDHYALDRTWEELVRRHVRRLMAIDDLANRSHDVDILLDVTPAEDDRYGQLVSPETTLLLGPRFALLRPEFRRLRARVDRFPRTITRVFITFGGIDAENWTGAAIEAVRRAFGPSVEIDVAIGGSASHIDRLLQLAAFDPALAVHKDTPNVAEIMAVADLAIGAGGTTSWERACLGLPAVLSPIADNQRDTISALSNAGCVFALRADRTSYPSRLADVLILIGENLGLLRQMSQAARELVDGSGTLRVVRELLFEFPKIRRATADDALDIWNWRNDPRVREASRNPKEITWEEHRQWFESALTNDEIALLVCVVAEQPTAVLRFDISGDTTEVSIYLTPHGFGRGLATDILLAGEAWLRFSHPKIVRIAAIILPGNTRSIAAFVGAGYESQILRFVRELR